VVLVGLDRGPITARPIDLVTTERELIGSLSHVWHEDFRIAIDFLASGRVRAAPVISDRLPLSRAISDGFNELRAGTGEHLKILVSPQEESDGH